LATPTTSSKSSPIPRNSRRTLPESRRRCAPWKCNLTWIRCIFVRNSTHFRCPQRSLAV
jgi:hypothetical protein